MIPVGGVPLELVGEFLGGYPMLNAKLVGWFRRLVGPDEVSAIPNAAARVTAGLEAAVYVRHRILIVLIGGLILGFLVWAGWAQLEEVTRGEGRVIPSAKVQVIQSLEGGIVKEVLVRTGDAVKKGDVLLRLDDTGFRPALGSCWQRKPAWKLHVNDWSFNPRGPSWGKS